MSAPWSRMVAYDLNSGTVKWQVPLGVDRLASAQGGAASGVPRGSQRMGMIVTSTGLIFATAKDGKVRAHSADDGKHPLDRSASARHGRPARDVRSQRPSVPRRLRDHGPDVGP